MMMRRTVVSGIAMMLAAASLTLSAYAQQSSTAFTYQGFLKDNNNPANAKYDLQFTLYDAPTGGNQIGNPVVIEDLQITNGLFTVEIDFGINPFSSGQRRWIEIGIRPFNSTRPFVTLDPRIELTPVPYAIYAQKAKDAENAQNAQNAQNAVNAQNAQNAQNAVNAQNAQNAVNAQNAQTAAVANSVAPNSVDSAGLANDPDSLSKVSGEALSIVNGHIKRTNNVYFYATGLKTFGERGDSHFYLLPQDQRGIIGWVPLAFDRIISNIGGGSYTATTGSGSNQQTIGEYTVPVSGYYMISANVAIFTWDDIISTVALQRQASSGGDWQTLGAYYSKISSRYDGRQQDGLTIHGVFYLNQDDKIRVAAFNRGAYNTLVAPRSGGSLFAYPPFVPENHHLTIYLLSAADAPQ
jgi:hypothetical protein